MTAIREHLKHHHRHMLVCVVGAVILVIGLALSVPAIAIAGAVICGAGCLSMVWMVVTAARSDQRATT